MLSLHDKLENRFEIRGAVLMETALTILNVTACSRETVGASVLIASLDRVPVCLWSEALSALVWLPGWELPALTEREERSLQDLLNGVSANQIRDQRFLSRWLPVVGTDGGTGTAVILREWFSWRDYNRRGQDSEYA